MCPRACLSVKFMGNVFDFNVRLVLCFGSRKSFEGHWCLKLCCTSSWGLMYLWGVTSLVCLWRVDLVMSHWWQHVMSRRTGTYLSSPYFVYKPTDTNTQSFSFLKSSKKFWYRISSTCRPRPCRRPDPVAFEIVVDHAWLVDLQVSSLHHHLFCLSCQAIFGITQQFLQSWWFDTCNSVPELITSTRVEMC